MEIVMQCSRGVFQLMYHCFDLCCVDASSPEEEEGKNKSKKRVLDFGSKHDTEILSTLLTKSLRARF